MRKAINLKYYIIILLCIISVTIGAQSKEQLRLPSILSDHMLLQENSNIKFWGWAAPRTTINIIPSWSSDTISLKSTEKAKWETTLQTPSAGGPYTIKVETKGKSITIEDVLIGELWLCSGQSNMEWSAQSGSVDAQEDLATCANNEIRLFFIEKASADYPQEDCSGYWRVCSAESMRWFSSVGYFFGKKLQNSLQVPIGLIHSNWGGTAAEAWTPAEKIQKDGNLYKAWETLEPSTGWDNTISGIYNAMIHPITKMKLAGVIWYQGEANVTNAYTYSELMSTLIQSWREKFQTNLPFYYVQIAPYNRYPIPYSAALLREQQEKTMNLSGTGMVVVSDCVNDINNIHPAYKKPVGDRLANWALANVYKRNVGKYKSATFDKIEIEKNKIRIFFKDADSGLQINGKEIECLEIAGEDGIYYPATGKIDKHTNTILAVSKEVKSPRNVRYQFSNNAVGNLFGVNGLPVAPFRTDNVKIDLTVAVNK